MVERTAKILHSIDEMSAQAWNRCANPGGRIPHDPFVRFNAYRALRTLANADHFADWIFGEARSHVRAIRGWKTWLANRKQ